MVNHKDCEDYVIASVEKKSGILNGIQKSWSHEGGFNLPIGNVKIDNLLFKKYHGCRQLRFYEENGIIGLRYKDNIVSWNVSELYELRKILDTFSEKFQCGKIILPIDGLN